MHDQLQPNFIRGLDKIQAVFFFLFSWSSTVIQADVIKKYLFMCALTYKIFY